MLRKLVKYAGLIPEMLIKRGDAEDILDDIYNDINMNIRPMMTAISAQIAKGDIDTSDISLLKGSLVTDKDKFENKFKKASDVLSALDKTITGMEDGKADMVKSIKAIPKTTSTTSIQANHALVFNTMDNMQFFINVTADILIAILESMAKVDGTDESVFSKRVLQGKKYLLFDWYSILVNYSDFNMVIIDLGNITITKDNSEMVSMTGKHTKAVARISSNKGFSGNPIYHFQLFLIDSRKSRIKVIEKKKEYVELLLSELELGDVYDPEIEAQIDNAKELVNSYELKLEKLSS